jgi:hypothetical protein
MKTGYLVFASCSNVSYVITGICIVDLQNVFFPLETCYKTEK